MRLQDFKKCFSSLEPNGTFLLWGTETFFINRIISRLKELLFGQGDREDTGCVTLYAADCRASDVAAAASTQSFFGAKSLVIVHNIADFSKAGRDVLKQYLSQQTPAAVLVLTDTTSHGFPMPSHPAIPKGKARSIDVSSPPVREFERWIAYLLSRDGKSISAGAMASLRENVGNSITVLAMELEKLVCLAGDRGVITEKHTEALLGRSRSEREYAVADAVASGDRTQALTALSDLLREGCNVSRIIGTLASQLERIWKAKEMLQEGRTNDDVCKELRIPTWRKDAFVTTASRSRRERLRKARASLVNAELRARSAKLDDRIIAELLVADLCRPPERRRRTAP